MLQGANIDIFTLYSIQAKAHNSEGQNVLFPLQIEPLKVNSKLDCQIFIFAPSALMG